VQNISEYAAHTCAPETHIGTCLRVYTQTYWQIFARFYFLQESGWRGDCSPQRRYEGQVHPGKLKAWVAFKWRLCGTQALTICTSRFFCRAGMNGANADMHTHTHTDAHTHAYIHTQDCCGEFEGDNAEAGEPEMVESAHQQPSSAMMTEGEGEDDGTSKAPRQQVRLVVWSLVFMTANVMMVCEDRMMAPQNLVRYDLLCAWFYW